jgi:hypothetical protein
MGNCVTSLKASEIKMHGSLLEGDGGTGDLPIACPNCYGFTGTGGVAGVAFFCFAARFTITRAVA